MKTNKEIITEIIEDLENTVGLNWSKSKIAKVTREKLIECWSDYRKNPDYKFYNYSDKSSLSYMYPKIFNKTKTKSSKCESWKAYILRLYNYKYCSKCKNLKKLVDYTADKSQISRVQPICIKCQANYAKTVKPKQKYTKKQLDHKRNYNREYIKQNKEQSKKYRFDNKEHINAYNMKRKAAKLKRTPSWLTKQDYNNIKDYYKLAKIKEQETGIKYHVDHIIPLQGKLVCGLHVPTNLQVITATENLSKSNKY